MRPLVRASTEHIRVWYPTFPSLCDPNLECITIPLSRYSNLAWIHVPLYVIPGASLFPFMWPWPRMHTHPQNTCYPPVCDPNVGWIHMPFYVIISSRARCIHIPLYVILSLNPACVTISPFMRLRVHPHPTLCDSNLGCIHIPHFVTLTSGAYLREHRTKQYPLFCEPKLGWIASLLHPQPPSISHFMWPVTLTSST